MKDAVARRFEIIGEAASHISDKIKEQYPKIEWRLMKDMRNLLIHEYFGVDYPTLYMTVQSNLPGELEKLRQIDLNKI
jgi:uncharacterized protein with HEPN domain